MGRRCSRQPSDLPLRAHDVVCQARWRPRASGPAPSGAAETRSAKTAAQMLTMRWASATTTTTTMTTSWRGWSRSGRPRQPRGGVPVKSLPGRVPARRGPPQLPFRESRSREAAARRHLRACRSQREIRHRRPSRDLAKRRMSKLTARRSHPATQSARTSCAPSTRRSRLRSTRRATAARVGRPPGETARRTRDFTARRHTVIRTWPRATPGRRPLLLGALLSATIPELPRPLAAPASTSTASLLAQ
mmetsp:Transcript_46712/g.118235  ORF Transcript_46712/g.118235 Transcript_46712/m.118235 type:complete len:247 (+) Transcript_46712:285-1025(+)